MTDEQTEAVDRLDEAPRVVTAKEIRSYGGCKIHRAWKLLCCRKDLVVYDHRWVWRDGKPAKPKPTRISG